ncbi:hypothetical protein [Kitasatospora sp. KL5]|uniref:hypothetical protein n=1 Tax=Kitasatospora sp. KL5 TaxID=3425125 RepID=UPI003D6E7239
MVCRSGRRSLHAVDLLCRRGAAAVDVVAVDVVGGLIARAGAASRPHRPDTADGLIRPYALRRPRRPLPGGGGGRAVRDSLGVRT